MKETGSWYLFGWYELIAILLFSVEVKNLKHRSP
jgi:hypothetical protein